MILIFVIIFAVQYNIDSDQGKLNIRSIIETTVLWSVISYIVLSIIVLGVALLTTSSD